MNIYLSVFIEQIKKLMKDGLTIVTENGTVLTYYIKIFCFPVDSVARPVMQNRLQFNGAFGCSWCYHQGNSIARSKRYVLMKDDPALRTHKEYLNDVKRREKDIKEMPKTKKN